MLKVRIIPCLDVKDGRVVKGVNFVDLRDAGDPVEAATPTTRPAPTSSPSSTSPRATRTATPSSTWCARTAEACFMPLTVGGGVRTVEDIRKLLACRRRQGLDQHRGGGRAATSSRRRRKSSAPSASSSPSTPRRCRSPGEPDRWEIFTHGGRNPTGLDAVAYAREVVALGAGEILLTSMDRDGTKAGFDLALTRAVADAVPVPVIASGGVGTLDHLVEGIRDGHATAVLAASIFHFGEYSVREAKAHMAAAGLADAARSSDRRLSSPLLRMRLAQASACSAGRSPRTIRRLSSRSSARRKCQAVELLRSRPQPRFVVVRLCGLEHRRRIDVHEAGQNFAEGFGSSIRRPRRTPRSRPQTKVFAPALRQPDQRHTRGKRPFCGNGSGRRNGISRPAASRSMSRHM